jgi:folate-binding protein YgfZ
VSTEGKTLHESPLRGESDSLGATMGEWFDCRLPSRFGEISAGIQAAQRSVALFDTNFRSFLSLTGPDRARYLNAVTTADIKNLVEGQGCVGLLLNPQGHILAEIETYSMKDQLLLVTHTSVLARTRETLDRFIIMDDCALEDVSALYGSLAVEGPHAPALIERLCGPAPGAIAAWTHVQVQIAGNPCTLVRRSFYSVAEGNTGFEIFAEPANLVAIWRVLLDAARAKGGGPAGYEALNLLRLEAGIPWFGYDFNDKALPHEAGLENSHISYTKGCYTGQEIVERVRSRGHVNRRRTMLLFQGSGAPPAGTLLLAGGAEAGVVTSAAYSPKWGAGIGMGYVRREHAAPGSRLEFPGGTAEVIELPATPRATPTTTCG